ncbi:Phospholipase A 2A, IIA,PLA2A isoform 1 [Hibiscus syriacus]|uniref:Phospholipase A 2A, IIA,PLA2A isoform 1 n=1 Tax=Hibiscus syriacus TaxID=106335 RepID=A0A6A2YVM1_HIBSY|nr:Phospholipase A 2A, IIA,PLA2A isoform 1 [Hibiscus syriacus]
MISTFNTAPKSSPKMVTKLFKSLSGPKYDGEYLHNIVRENLGETRLDQTLTKVVIPTFDIKIFQPTIFFSYDDSQNVLLSDICIGLWLRQHIYQHIILKPKTLVAMREVAKAIARKSSDYDRIEPNDYACFQVLSLGTGSQKLEENDMVDFYLAIVFGVLHCEENYLRIQDDTLSGELALIDISTKENLENLVKIGEQLLNKPVSRVDLSFKKETDGKGCYFNQEAQGVDQTSTRSVQRGRGFEREESSSSGQASRDATQSGASVEPKVASRLYAIELRMIVMQPMRSHVPLPYFPILLIVIVNPDLPIPLFIMT